MKVSIIGCGNIGKELAKFMDNDPHFTLVGLVDIKAAAVTDTLAPLKKKVPRMSIKEAVEAADLIIESADKNVVGEIIRLCAGKKVLILSVAGLIDLTKPPKCDIYIPSGAIAGLDAIKAVRGKIQELKLISTKPPRALGSAPYLIEKSINIEKITEQKVVFQGNFRDAIKGFPQNINVAASLYLASRFEKLQVTIIADPTAALNTHEIACIGEFGTITLKTENKPSKNPKTSYLAILSAISILKSLNEPYKF